MHRTIRMLGILLALQHGDATLAELAERFGCSTKTIQRDLTALTELNIPIRTTAGYGGGVRLDDGWWLGSPNLSTAELETLILALEATVPSEARTNLIEKLRGAVRPHHYDAVEGDTSRPRAWLGMDDVDADLLTSIRSAMARSLWMRVDYAGSSQAGERRVLPTSLFIRQGHWYVDVIDERSRDTRLFRVDRIRSAIPCLAPPDAAEIVADAQAQPGYHDASHPLVVAELTPAGLRYCQDQLHLRDALDGSRLTFRCPPADLRYLGIALLQMGPDCRVIEPPELIAHMRERVRELERHLADEPDRQVSTPSSDTGDIA